MAKEAPRRQRPIGMVSTQVERNTGGAKSAEKNVTSHPALPEDVGEHPGYVMIKGGITRNVGEYNSVNVQVSVGMPCVATLEAAEKKYHEVAPFVDKLLTRELNIALHGDEGGGEPERV